MRELIANLGLGIFFKNAGFSRFLVSNKLSVQCKLLVQNLNNASMTTKVSRYEKAEIYMYENHKISLSSNMSTPEYFCLEILKSTGVHDGMGVER